MTENTEEIRKEGLRDDEDSVKKRHRSNSPRQRDVSRTGKKESTLR